MALPFDPDGLVKPIFIARMKDLSDNDNLAVDGSLSSKSFYFNAPTDKIVRVCSWFLYIQDEKGFDITEFGSTGTSLINGIEVKGTFGSVEHDLLGFNLKSNADIMSVTYDMDLKTFGNADDVLMAKWNFTESAGQFLRLDGSQGDKLEIVVNDNLTGISKFHIMVQGYIEDKAW